MAEALTPFGYCPEISASSRLERNDPVMSAVLGLRVASLNAGVGRSLARAHQRSPMSFRRLA